MVISHQPHRHGASAKCPDVGGDVPGSSQVIGFTGDFHDRNRSFRGYAPDFTPDEFVEHHVAEDENPFSDEGGDELISAAAGECHDSLTPALPPPQPARL